MRDLIDANKKNIETNQKNIAAIKNSLTSIKESMKASAEHLKEHTLHDDESFKSLNNKWEGISAYHATIDTRLSLIDQNQSNHKALLEDIKVQVTHTNGRLKDQELEQARLEGGLRVIKILIVPIIIAIVVALIKSFI